MTRSLNDFTVLFSKRKGEEYSDEMVGLIFEWRELALKTFLETEHAYTLSKTALRHAYLISVFADLAYNYHLNLPGHWTEDTIEDVCCDLMPRKLMAGKEAFTQLPRILKKFFLWGESVGIFQGRAEWCEALADCKGAIVDNAETPSNWGMAKSLFSRW